ncbi:MAG: hypothetical protein LAQ30_13065 [Acidobacteriia bacterium]|nr:hypothetical protein [Terriglobia bacterium]
MAGTRTVAAAAAVVALWAGARIAGQQSASTTLVVHVPPEAHLNPPAVSLRFRLPADASQAVPFSAWVRALPNQRIGVTAVLRDLSGPAGAVPGSALRWRGSRSAATHGGAEAACAGGSFATGASQQLVSGWNRSGTLTCALVFSLSEDLPPGDYSGSVSLMFAEPLP